MIRPDGFLHSRYRVLDSDPRPGLSFLVMDRIDSGLYEGKIGPRKKEKSYPIRSMLLILLLSFLFQCEKNDTLSPTITRTIPEDGATDVSINTNITIAFSEPMDTASVWQAFRINPTVTGSVSWSNDNVLLFTPGANFDSSTTYTVTIATAARDRAGNNLSAEYIFSFTTGSQVFSGSYYVATNGDDSNPGTITQPFRTIQHAAEVAKAGDTVCIRDGIYTERVEVANSGNETEGDIVFAAYSGEKPAIDGTGTGESNGFVISNKSYIKLIGLEIRNWDEGNAVWIESSHHFELTDCEIHHAVYGIGMGGTHDFELNRVKMHDFDLYGFDASPSGGELCYNGTFNDCISYTGRDPRQNVDGFALGHGEQHDFVFNRCIAYDVYDGFDMSARNTTLNRCLAYNCWNAGYKLWQDSIKLVNCIGYHNSSANIELDWSGTAKSVNLQNCTLVDGGVFNIWIENSQDGLTMTNCLLAGGDNIGLCFEQTGVNNYHGDYNIFHNDDANRAVVVGYEDEFTLGQVKNGGWTAYSGEDSHSQVAADPNSLFQNLDAWDLHLKADCIAIDKGTAQGAPTEDFDGNPRPYGAGYDIGAFEWSP
jgi:hypothetical protein